MPTRTNQKTQFFHGSVIRDSAKAAMLAVTTTNQRRSAPT